MLGRFIHFSPSVRRFFCSSSLAPELFRLKDTSKAPDIIAKWKEEGHAVPPNFISSAVRGLINHSRYNEALGILDSLVKEKSVELKPRDYALHLGLIAKVRGLDSSEIFFESIPERVKGGSVYEALLDIYVKSGETAKAEALMDKIAENGIYLSCRPYIVMMSHYMSNGKDDKVEEMIKEVKKYILPNCRMYNMWLNACASANNVEASEMVVSEMKEAKVDPNWLTHSILASLYIENNLFEKAASSLKEMEDLISIRNRKVYCSLVTQHARIGNKDAVLRIWDNLKLKFKKLKDGEYFLMISALLKIDSYEKAEEINSEWAAHIEEREHGVSKLYRSSLKLLKKAKDEQN